MTPADARTRELADQARDEVAAAASRAESRNRPRVFILASSLALAIAFVMLVLGMGAKANADSSLRRERAQANEAVELLARLRQLDEAAKDSTKLPFGEQLSKIRSKITDAASRAGLKSPPQLPVSDQVVRNVAAGVNRNTWTYEVRDPSLRAMLDWLQLAIKDIPGFEVYSVTLKPEQNQWYLRVTFSRLERSS
ncbi:MAG: hypothetical protein SFZ23_05535 [Planctomycetota bacterium]|nr:hypothetical protein [Planctomycetota bacterium]